MRFRRQSGFTIMELVIVMMIMGIVAATALPRYFDALARFRVTATAKRMVADLALAKRTAKQDSTTKTIKFDTDTNSYILMGIASMDRRGQVYKFDLDQAEYGATLISVDFSGNSQVIYDIYGMPDNPGTIVFQSGNQQVTLGVDNEGEITESAPVAVPSP